MEDKEKLEKEEKTELEDLMAEGYVEMAEENRKEAEEWLEITRDVILRDE